MSLLLLLLLFVVYSLFFVVVVCVVVVRSFVRLSLKLSLWCKVGGWSHRILMIIACRYCLLFVRCSSVSLSLLFVCLFVLSIPVNSPSLTLRFRRKAGGCSYRILMIIVSFLWNQRLGAGCSGECPLNWVAQRIRQYGSPYCVFLQKAVNVPHKHTWPHCTVNVD